MTNLMSLGELYVSDFLADGEEPRSEPTELRLVQDEATGVVQLSEQPPAELMWGRYWYRSGTNESMRRALGRIVKAVADVVPTPEMQMITSGRRQPVQDLWVDIACNDGTLLGMVDTVHYRSATPCPYRRVGVDPVEGDIHDEAVRHYAHIVQAPFTSSVAADIVSEHGRARVVTCIAMFYDLLDPTDFLAGVKYLLASDGLFVLQMSYTPLMVMQRAFDNICHEHARYYTLATLDTVLHEAGFQIIDATVNEVNGGSFRVLACHAEADLSVFGSQPWRDVAQWRKTSLIMHEWPRAASEEVWSSFADDVAQLKHEVVTFIKDVRARGESVWGYGASTKGNTLLQYFGLDGDLVTAIAERQEQKWGLRTVGSNIPIVSEDEMRAAKPDYLLVLPWHFISEFQRREKAFLEAGGKFIVPCPRFEVIG